MKETSQATQICKNSAKKFTYLAIVWECHPMTWEPDVPYNALPPPPDADTLETRPVLRAVIGANSALAKLDQAAVSMPNPTVLINSIPILEAQASSEIENIVTTTDELFRHIDDAQRVVGAQLPPRLLRRP
ncbi:Fic/DOC family N-terminal domain-containing protein [Gordonia bronchialis]|uniref:Fic/DOC family N-terminal domain-containing protein n=1 Tax=Gordonia bronchialis TaxID=2054 RepID=UPI001CBAA6F5|nr:Fic/DOC family N-terminal domain-containing protein [Gordonia bronchialis]